MKLNQITIALALATAATAGFARNMPHVELVGKYLQHNQYEETLGSCKTRPMAAPAGNGHEVECWAANAANDLRKEPDAVVKLVLNGPALEVALSRCKALSMEQRFKSVECAAAVHADTFILLRLPRTVDTLTPVKFRR